MDPEKQPRRSKADQEPLTIDLEANASDTTRTASETAETASESVSAQSTEFPEVPADISPDTKTDADAEEDARADAAASAFAEEPAPLSEPAHSPPPQARPAPTASSLAAGILGGLIALLGAGSLQYAGVIPSLGSEGTAATGPAYQSLEGDIQTLRARLDALPATPPQGQDLSPLDAHIAALEKSVSGQATQSADVSTIEPRITVLTEEIAALKSELADSRQSAEAAKTELATRLDAAEKKIDEPASDVQLARAMAVTALKTAIDRGGPFLAELDALKTISPDEPAVSGLAPEASGGVASRADLTRDFPDVADTMLEATRHRDPDQGIVARLIDSASSAIKIRPVGSVEGTGADAVIARIEDRLTNGDFKGAQIEWEALPEDARTAGAAFKSKLDQRLRVEGLIDAAVSGALTVKQG